MMAVLVGELHTAFHPESDRHDQRGSTAAGISDRRSVRRHAYLYAEWNIRRRSGSSTSNAAAPHGRAAKTTFARWRRRPPPHLLHQVEPVYPPLAKQARIQRDVVLSAVIDAKGNIVDLKVVSGHPLLYQAAINAVGQWTFEPTYLNGEPWPVSHEITVHFRL